MNGLLDSQLNGFKIYPLDPEFYSGQDPHKRTDGRTDGLSVILGFATALSEPLRNNNPLFIGKAESW